MKTLILKILPIGVLMLWAGGSLAQPIGTTAATATYCPGQIVVPVTVTNCTGVGAISLALDYDNAELTYTGYQNLHASLSSGMLIVNSTGSRVIFSWVNTTPASPGNATLFELKFNAVPGVASLNWDTQTPGNCEYTNTAGTVLPSEFFNGTATVQQPPLIQVQPVPTTVFVGFNTSLSVSATATNLQFQWQISTNSGTTWGDLTNGPVYGNVNGNVLYITNAQLSMNGYLFRCRLTGTCPPVTNTDEVALTVVNPVTTTLPTASFCPGSIVVPVTVTNFSGVAAFSLAFTYNPSCLTFTGSQNVNPALAGGTLVVNASGGTVFMTWSSTTPVTFGNGTIVQLLFNAATGASPLTWDVLNEGNCEYVALSGQPIATVFVDGSETIYGLPAITSHPAGKIIAKGQNTTFSVTTTGSGLVHKWQLSTDGGTLFNDLAEGGTYTGTNSTTLAVNNAQLAMSGYKFRCKVTGTCTPVAYSNPATLTVLPNIVTQCGSTTVCPGQVIIPVNVTDFIGVAAFSLTLNFNPATLTYTGYQNLHANLASGAFTASAAGGKVYLTWANTTAATIPTNGLLVELTFTGVPGSSSLTWDTQTPGGCEYSDYAGLIIYSTWNNGSVTVQVPPSISAHPVNRTMYATGSTTFSVTAAGTGLSYLWQVSTNGGATWTNLSNTAPYSGAFTHTLTVNPVSTGLNGYRYHCIVSGTCPPPVTSDPATLTVTQAAISNVPGPVTNSCTGNLTVPLNVTNCSNVGSISLTLIYDTTKLTYEGYQSVHAGLNGGILTVNRSLNKIYLTWASASAANIGNGVLLQYRFRANANVSTTLTWDTPTPGACEYADPNGTIISSLYTNGNVSTASNALVVDAGPDVVMTGSSIQLNGAATGGTTPYTWSWTPVASLNNPAVPNPVASPAVTTQYTLTVTATGGCTGSDAVNVVVEIPQNLTLQGIDLVDGSTCYNAYQVITVAGSGTTFTVHYGAEAIIIAGQKIRYLDGTRVHAGGKLHGYITQTAQYCSSLPASMVTAVETPDARVQPEAAFRVFPNPAKDRFTLSATGEDFRPGTARVFIVGSRGEKIAEEWVTLPFVKEFPVAGWPSGLYIIRLVSPQGTWTIRLIRQ